MEETLLSGAVTTISTGNLFIPPAELAKATSIAWKTIQPQTLYRVTGNPKWLNMTADQARYRFLLGWWNGEFKCNHERSHGINQRHWS